MNHKHTNLSDWDVDAHGLRRLSADRVLGMLLILLQLSALAYLSGARAFPITIGAISLWGLWSRVRIRVEPMPLSFVYCIMAVAYLLHHFVAPFELQSSDFIRSSLAHTIARFLISVQVLQLFLHHPAGRLPVWLTGCGAVAMVFAANLRVPQFIHDNLLVLISLFVGLSALYSSSVRRKIPVDVGRRSSRQLIMSAALVTVVLLSAGSSWMLQRFERDIEWFLSDYLGYGGRTAQAGFTPRGRLHSVTEWKTKQAENVMLRVFADEAPGYLRGKAFDTYQGASRETSYTAWVSTLGRRPMRVINESRHTPKLRPGDHLFELQPEAGSTGPHLDVWPAEHAPTRIFTTLETTLLAVNGDDARMDGHGIITIDDRTHAVPYMAFESPEARSKRSELGSGGRRALLTSLDGPIDPNVRQLAGDIFADCRTSRQKIDAVQTFFHENFQYKLAMNVPHRMDPITYFLTRRPPAHCEYFASGTAVLLRLVDVPCRYVVGYVSQEWNEVGGFWVARNKDAHAWVEAFDEEAGQWVIVESTPGEGVPQPREPRLASQLADSFRHRLSIWRMTLREYGFVALGMSLVRVVWSIPGLVLLLGLLTLAVAKYRSQLFPRRVRDRTPEHLKDMHRMLARLDRLAEQQGFRRADHETLTHFADRLRQSGADTLWSDATANCYSTYVDLRYHGQTGPSAVHRLRVAAARIPSTTEKPHR